MHKFLRNLFFNLKIIFRQLFLKMTFHFRALSKYFYDTYFSYMCQLNLIKFRNNQSNMSINFKKYNLIKFEPPTNIIKYYNNTLEVQSNICITFTKFIYGVTPVIATIISNWVLKKLWIMKNFRWKIFFFFFAFIRNHLL